MKFTKIRVFEYRVLIIVFPMAGRSERFRSAGYDLPKFKLPLHGATMFDHAVASFEAYFQTASFLFIARDKDGAEFADVHARGLGVRTFLTTIDQSPSSLAETVFRGIEAFPEMALDQSVLIHVIDTFRPDFKLPQKLGSDGFAELCLKPEKGGLDHLLRLPVEPQQGQSRAIPLGFSLLGLRGTGLIYMPHAKTLRDAFWRLKKCRGSRFGMQQSFRRFGISEPFVEGLSLLNALRGLGQQTHLRLVPRDDVLFCGVPKEYEALSRCWPTPRTSLRRPRSRTLDV